MKACWLLMPFLVTLVAGTTPADPPRPGPGRGAALASVIEHGRTLIQQGDVDGATKAADRAARLARKSGRWAALTQAGDLYGEIAAVSPDPAVLDERARGSYREALGVARREQSLDGTLLVADAFARLGHTDDVEESLRAAERLATFDPESESDVRAAAARLADILAGRLDADE